jgi:hypothetical protein
LRELVLDQGEALARLTAEHVALKARVTALESAPAREAAELEAACAMADAAEYDRHGRDCGCGYCHVPPEERQS